MHPPQYGTPRRLDRPTTGEPAAGLAFALGLRPLPWQLHVLEVAGELVADDDTGQPVHAYTTVTVSVGRRAGKSLLTLLRLLDLVTFTPAGRGWYTAQSRADAALALRDEWRPMVMAAPLMANRFTFRLSNGSESITWPAANAGAYLFAPTPTSLHGRAGDLIVFDEAWAHHRARGEELEVAARPLMATRPGAQTWMLSAAGDIDSTWWIHLLEQGRNAAAADRGRGHAHFEWTGEGTGLDPDSPDTWKAVHPALRSKANPFGTIPLEFLRGEHERDPDQFRRLYLNMTDRTGTAATPIDPTRWASLAVDPFDRATGSIVAAVECAPEQAATAIVMCGEHDGTTVLEVVDHRPGTAWVPDRIAELVDRWNLEAVALDRGGPAGALYDRLEVAGVPVQPMQLRDQCAAAAQLVEAVRTGEVAHVSDDALTVAVAAARRRPVGDGAWAFSRTASSADASPLIAAALARSVHPSIAAAAPAVY